MTVRRTSCRGSSKTVTKTSTVRSVGAGGGSWFGSRQTVQVNSEALMIRYVSASARAIAKAATLQLIVPVQRHQIQYQPYARATSANVRIAHSSRSERMGTDFVYSRGAVASFSIRSRP